MNIGVSLQSTRDSSVGYCALPGNFKTYRDMGLSAQIINFVRLHSANNVYKVGGITQITVMKEQAHASLPSKESKESSDWHYGRMTREAGEQ